MRYISVYVLIEVQYLSNRHASPSSNKHTTSVKGQIHTKSLIKHQKIAKKQ